MKNPKAIEALRRRVEQERQEASPRRVQFTDELRRDVLAVIAKPDWGPGRVARALGVARSMLDGWAKQSERSRKRKASHPGRQRLRRVEIVDDPRETTTSALVLELPCGAKVRGLTVKQLARLLEVKS